MLKIKEIDWKFDDEENEGYSSLYNKLKHLKDEADWLAGSVERPGLNEDEIEELLNIHGPRPTLKIERFDESEKDNYFSYFTDIYNISSEQLKSTGWRKYNYYRSKLISKKNRILKSKTKIKNRILFLILRKEDGKREYMFINPFKSYLIEYIHHNFRFYKYKMKFNFDGEFNSVENRTNCKINIFNSIKYTRKLNKEIKDKKNQNLNSINIHINVYKDDISLSY